jgi:2-polyprenyl-3-methyl-5-hydroxy-6-metoxy-1,4-benzoquinol methylase
VNPAESLLCCPLCHEALQEQAEGSRCPRCARVYRRAVGLPDLRLQTPAGFDAPKDLYLAELLHRQEERLDFRELLAYYYKLDPPANDQLHTRHMAHFEVEGEQAEAALGELAGRRVHPETEALLDVGCGLGRYLRAAAAHFSIVAGIDLSLAQLVLARKHLSESGQTALLVAAQSECLPFRATTFGAALAADSLEHVADPSATVDEVARVLLPGGGFYLSTPNRFSLTPEPHVGVWGLGYWPRSWAVRYVRRKLGVAYEDIRLFSFWTLRRLLRGCFAGSCEIRLPSVGRREAESFSPLKRRAAWLYETTRSLPAVRAGLYAIAPYFQAICVKRPSPMAE